MVFSFVLVFCTLLQCICHKRKHQIIPWVILNHDNYQRNTESQYLDNLINSLSNMGQSGFWGLFQLFQRTQLSILKASITLRRFTYFTKHKDDRQLSRRKKYSVFLRISKSRIVVLNAFSIHLNIKALPE